MKEKLVQATIEVELYKEFRKKLVDDNLSIKDFIEDAIKEYVNETV